MKKPTVADVLRIALTPDIEAELDRVMNMTHDEVCASLKARGHDLRVLQAEADIYWSKMHPKRKMHGSFMMGGIAFVSTAAIGIAGWAAPALETAPSLLPLAAHTAPADPPTTAATAAPAPTLDADAGTNGGRNEK